jgi:hypothetical protein
MIDEDITHGRANLQGWHQEYMGRCSARADLSNIHMVHACVCRCAVRATDMIEVVPSIWVLCCSDAVYACMHTHR